MQETLAVACEVTCHSARLTSFSADSLAQGHRSLLSWEISLKTAFTSSKY